MLEIVICDDVENHNKFTKNSIEKILTERALPGKIVLVTQSADEIKLLPKNSVHERLYIMDIDINGGTEGIEIIEEIRAVDRKSYIVYITAHEEYSLLAYRTKTFDYLIKPLRAEEIQDLILRVFDDIEEMNDTRKQFVFQTGAVAHNIPLNEILYFEKERNILHIITESNRLSGYESLKSVMERLPEGFIMCNKSYVVSADKISKIDKIKNIVYLVNGEIIPLSRHYKKSVLSLLEVQYVG